MSSKLGINLHGQFHQVKGQSSAILTSVTNYFYSDLCRFLKDNSLPFVCKVNAEFFDKETTKIMVLNFLGSNGNSFLVFFPYHSSGFQRYFNLIRHTFIVRT